MAPNILRNSFLYAHHASNYSAAARIAVFNVRGLCLSVLSVLSLYGISGLSKVSIAQTDTHQHLNQDIERRFPPRAMQDFDRYGNQVHLHGSIGGSWHGLLFPMRSKIERVLIPTIIAEEYAVYLARPRYPGNLSIPNLNKPLISLKAQWPSRAEMVSCSKASPTWDLRPICGYDLFRNIPPSSRQTLRIVDKLALIAIALAWRVVQQWQTSDSASAGEENPSSEGGR